MFQTVSVSDSKCQLDVKIYGHWERFKYRIAHPGDPQIQARLTCVDDGAMSTVSVGNYFFPRNLNGSGLTRISGSEFKYMLINKGMSSIDETRIEELIERARSNASPHQ